MLRSLVALCGAGVAVVAPAISIPLDSSQDPCRLVSRGEAAALMSSTELLVVGDSATFERGRGDHHFSNCSYSGQALGLEVKWRAFSAAATARDFMTERSVPDLLPGADSVSAAPGLGERAYWVTGKNPFDGNAFGAYSVLSGGHVVTLWLGGEGFTGARGAELREALRKVTVNALGRL